MTTIEPYDDDWDGAVPPDDDPVTWLDDEPETELERKANKFVPILISLWFVGIVVLLCSVMAVAIVADIIKEILA